MVCPRCVMVVEQLLGGMCLAYSQVALGTAHLVQEPSEEQLALLKKRLSEVGFELLDDPQMKLVERIRVAEIEWVRMNGERVVLSQYVQQEVCKDYSSLSKLFREVKGMTIERYCIIQRIEYAKELFCYSELNISEVADRLGYSSPAHLSSQFRQETGMTPKDFRGKKCNQSFEKRIGIDEL